MVIAGNIGVGKTTLTKLLHEKIGWTPYFEPVDENPYLKDFYGDMDRWGFHSQIYFLTQRFMSHLKIGQLETPVIQDRSIYEDAEVFVNSLYSRQILSKRDYETYRGLYSSMLEVLRPPDLTLYLRASPWTLLSRIRKRWRDVERDIDKEYLFQLNLAYEKWVKEWQKGHLTEIVDTDGHDFLDEPDWANGIVFRIESFYQSISYV